MLVNSPGLAIVSDQDYNANSPLICWHNLVTRDTVSASPAGQSGYPITNVANPITYLGWRGDPAGTTITVDTSAYAGLVDYMALERHNLGTLGLALTVSVDDGGGYDVVINAYTPTDDSPLIFRWEPGIYVSVKLQISSNSSVPFINVLYVGGLLRVLRRLYVGHAPINLNRSTQIVNGVSEGGDFLGAIQNAESAMTTISLKNLLANWYRDSFEVLLKANRTLPFFFAWRPNTYPKEVAFVWLTADPKPNNQLANGMMQVELQVNGLLL